MDTGMSIHASGKYAPMQQAVYDYLTRIPKGNVVTYGQIARYLGDPHLARAVGNMLHKNPDGMVYPCYKVVNAQGKLSRHYAFGGVEAQRRRLEQDGIRVENHRVDLAQYQWQALPERLPSE